MKKIANALFFLLISIGAFGQLTPVTNQYILNPLTINPAFAGNRGALNIAAFYRKQWVGINGAPETFTLSGDAPLFDNRVGVGLTIVSDRVGVSKETQVMSNYSYKLNLQKGTLSLGLGAGLSVLNTAWSELVVLDPGDELYLANTKAFVIPDFSLGAYYTYQKHFAGFSIPRLMSYQFNYEKNKYSVHIDPGHYNFMFMYGYIFDISKQINFIPSTMLNFSPQGKFLYDINAYFTYNNRFWVGVSIRGGRSVTGLFQFQVNHQLRIAYTYDYDFGQIGTYSNGSHEVMLRYEFRYKVDVASPLIF